MVSFTQRYAALDALTLFKVAAAAGGGFGFGDAVVEVELVDTLLGAGILDVPDAGIASTALSHSPSVQFGAPRAPKN